MIISYPDLSFAASLSGLQIWWKFVFPALLPYFILSEILLGLGVIHAMGVLLEPLMKRLFRLPGASGWAVAMSITIGIPAGAKTAVDLRKKVLVNTDEGNLLLALSHLCSPIFLTTVVAVGFWGNPELGMPLLFIHLVSALLTGFILAHFIFRKRSKVTIMQQPKRPLYITLCQTMRHARDHDGRPFGKLLGEAVSTSCQSLFIIGGMMIFFSVLLEILSILGWTATLTRVIQVVLIPWGMPAALAEGAMAGVLEIHLGTYAIAQHGETSVWTASMLSAVIGWGGLSIHAQVKSFIRGTDLRYRTFLLARMIQMFVSALTALLTWDALQQFTHTVSPVFWMHHSMTSQPEYIPTSWWDLGWVWTSTFFIMIFFVLILMMFSLLLYGLQRMRAFKFFNF
jgi:sporulation integral membrane protein YlbJ